MGTSKTAIQIVEDYFHEWGVEPGVINEAAEHVFMHGDCFMLAYAVHQETKWPLYKVTDSWNTVRIRGDEHAGDGSAIHWVVKVPDAGYLDIRGLHTKEELIEEYSDLCDDELAAVGFYPADDARLDYMDREGHEIPLETVSTLVKPLLEKYGITPINSSNHGGG